MAKKNKIDGGEVTFNMTPMIDVTFQLIIFFIIAGQMVSDDIEALIPPEPYKSQAIEERTKIPSIIVNIVSEAGDDPDASPTQARVASMWYIKGVKIEVGDNKELTARLQATLKGMSEEAQAHPLLEIRCDKRIQYSDVVPVMLAARDAGIPNMDITAIVDSPE